MGRGFSDDKVMHCTARLAEMLSKFSDELQRSSENNNLGDFFVEEIRVLVESNGIWLSNFLPHAAFQALLMKKVNGIAVIPVSFVSSVWDYVETVVINVVMHHSENYPQLQSSTRRAVQNIVSKMKDKSSERVMEIVEMEKLTHFTSDPEYLNLWNKLMVSHKVFLEIMKDHSKPTILNVEDFGDIDVCHLRSYPTSRDQAFDLKMRITAYWHVVLKRLLDSIALHLLYYVQKLVNKEMEVEIVNEIMGTQGGGGIERMLDESPSVAAKREKLNKSVKVLRESKEVVARIMDRVSLGGDK